MDKNTKTNKNKYIYPNGFSLAEALISLLIVCIITLASIPVITKKHRERKNVSKGMYACYWNGDQLVARSVINNQIKTEQTRWDAEEGRMGCVFTPPGNAKNFVVTIIGGGGGGAGSGTVSGNYMKKYTEPGTFSYTTTRAGLYRLLAVGGGGGGGGGYSMGIARRACTGTLGGLVYSQVILPKDLSMTITVGDGGAAGQNSMAQPNLGAMGGTSLISFNQNLQTKSMYARGGGGGCAMVFKSFPKVDLMISGFTSLGNMRNIDTGRVSGSGFAVWNQYASSIYSAPAGESSSNIDGARVVRGIRLGALSTSNHQNDAHAFIMIDALHDYDDMFGIKFNEVTKKTTGVCRFTNLRNTPLCKTYENHYGAGGGGGGEYGSVDFSAQDGMNGFVGISYKPVLAGLGGKAGKVLQIPYSEMSSGTMLFPGKGGTGGNYSSTLSPHGSHMTSNRNSRTAGSNGQASYIKNGTPVLGGEGAPAIEPRDESTYSQNINANSMPIGGDGEMSNVLTVSKAKIYGGLSGTNTSANGQTGTVFRNGAMISSFKNIYGAGSGGGGGAITINGTNFGYGSGGNGSSGLVFIQW